MTTLTSWNLHQLQLRKEIKLHFKISEIALF